MNVIIIVNLTRLLGLLFINVIKTIIPTLLVILLRIVYFNIIRTNKLDSLDEYYKEPFNS